MPFYVHAQDKPGVGAELVALSEAHWSYMDRFADRLVLRGPVLSEDGEEHAGSVHVVDLADRIDAERFANEEPFWQAGLYGQITTVRAVVLLDRGPTEASLAGEEPNSLTTGHWSPEPRSELNPLGDGDDDGDDPDSRLSFVAVLVDDSQSRTVGIVAVTRTLPDEAPSLIQPFADRLKGGPVALTAQRWCRGGRS
ncbi:YciI family protein [Streptomyces beijiangensis]|uniref:YCII-related domain-containing protein n=1 Tax=Streptomyces beijiangensis TaxID=163361 RepID=A0A939F562_9ACTN|nr:YciI family protein [Streptomyces beijiangensis]MBO0512096.1 hypothetical protein [Streptomyces beijiangensis]